MGKTFKDIINKMISERDPESGYTSPLYLYSLIAHDYDDWVKSLENEIVKEARKIRPTLDKEELIKMINGERDQYRKGFDKGYRQGCADMRNRLAELILEMKDQEEKE